MTTQLTQDEIRAVFMRNGFTIKDGQTDLKEYVYAAARELIAAHEDKQWIPCADRLPEIPEGAPCSDFVLAGYWYTDPHLADSARWKSRFIFGEGRVFEDRGHLLWDCRIGGIPTHWKPINPPAIAAKKGAADA